MKLVAGERPPSASAAASSSRRSRSCSIRPDCEPLATSHWATPPATPPLATAVLATTGPDPKVEVSRRTVVVTVPGDTRSVAVYRERTEGAFAIERITGVSSSMGTTAELTLEPGPWAVSVLDRRGVESRGARITVE